MGDRRILLGTSAVLVGVGSALISGTGVAAADTVDSDTGGPASTTSANTSTTSTTGTKARRAATRAKAASAVAAAAASTSSDTAEQAAPPAARGSVRASTDRVRSAPKNISPVTRSAVAPAASPAVGEADAASGKLSWASPLASALLGGKAGAAINSKRDGKEARLEIVSVSYPVKPAGGAK